MHKLAVGGKVASSWEFWQMTPGQVWWLLEDAFPELFARKIGNVDEIRDMVKRAKAKERKAQENG
jgi:hypothetical protein